MSDYIHLHNHTHYSLQDGACTVDSLLKAAKNNGMHAVALTDHGVLYGIPEFYRKAKKEGIKPIIGMEAYVVVDSSRFERKQIDESTGKKKKPYNHLILLAKNMVGYKNLVKLSSLGFSEGFYYRPRIDMELLEKYHEGLICTSACVGGVVASSLANNDYKKAKEVAIRFKEMFGDDFYLEVQDHNIDKELAVLEQMPKLAKELSIKLVATNDCHYINKEDSIAHNILLMLSEKSGSGDYKNLRYGTDQIYFKSQEEMKNLFKHLPQAIENTLEIDEKTNLVFNYNEQHFPVFPIPDDSPAKNLDEYLEILALEGLQHRFKEITPEIKERFNYEVSVIKSMGFPGYFLVVQDFINAAKRNNIPVGPGRGSAAGSLVAYALGITNIDPLKYDLLFERFLNPERNSMPDIDVDLADDQRGDVIDYVKKQYGSECVSQIITFNRLSSKAVLKDVARVLGIPIATINGITKHIPSKFGKVYTIEQSLNEVAELKWVKESKEETIQNLVKYAKVLEGMNRNASKHASGVVIAPGAVSDFVPLSSYNAQEELVTQFNMKELEDNGLLKMDFLGLRTLTIIKDTLKLIKKNHNIELDIDDIPLDDESTYQLFSKGQTTGVFQFESPPMREYLKKLKPQSILDLTAMNALYRPGPMEFIDDFIDRKHGRKKIEYKHPILESILKETNGIIVYQEQVMQLANKVAGMSLAQADILRRAMGKKDLAAMKQQKVVFVDGAKKNKVSEKIATEIFDDIDKFANYGFNKSHAVAYSVVAYQTAYLKVHYTPEFLAANLTHEFGDKNKVTNFLEDCRKLKIDVLPPNINKPSKFFDVEKGKIRFGFSAIKNVGVSAVESIIKSKEKLGRNFKSLFDFCMVNDSRIVNKRVLEGLILVGAFDSLNKNRAQLYAAVEQVLAYTSKAASLKTKSFNSLFSSDEDDHNIPEPELPVVEDWSENEKLAREREVIGFYVTGHPLRKYEVEYNSFATIRLGETEEIEKINNIKACGVITELTTKIDKRGGTMAFFTLDDFTGSCECLMFSSTYEKYGKFLKPEAAVLLIGKPESSGDAIKLHIEEVIPIEQTRELLTKFVKIVVEENGDTETKLEELKNILEKHPGKVQVLLEVSSAKIGNKGFRLSLQVKITEKFVKEIHKVLGEESLYFLPSLTARHAK
ncbi:MAG: DNA polymerase III subunit alpha [Ignavibacteria bacterium]|nr:DNA polymerase III subunit alpha [Ignavibacteria bacterium]